MGESFPTCYEQFIEYGRQQGRQEGRQEGRLEGIQEGIQEAKQEVIQKGIQLGTYRTLFKLVEDGDLSLEKAAKSVGLTVTEFLEKKKKYHSDSEWFN